MEYEDIIIVIPLFIMSILYIIGIAWAISSYQKYRFSAILFIPMALLLPFPYFILPIFAYAEYRKIKEQTPDPGVQNLLKLKRNISWIPAIGTLVINILFRCVFVFEMDISPEILNLISAHLVALILTVIVLWLNAKLTKAIKDIQQV